MVRAVEVEGLLQEYLDEKNLEKCDALHLLYTVSEREAAKTLRVRYGRSGAISSVLDDLRELGIQEIKSHEDTEDTKESIQTVIAEFFNRNCLNLVLESAKKRASTLSQPARELFYLISALYPEHVDINELRKFYRVLFQKQISETDFKRALEELCRCYVIQSVDWLRFPPYLDRLLYELREFMPKVEVKVSWE